MSRKIHACSNPGSIAVVDGDKQKQPRQLVWNTSSDQLRRSNFAQLLKVIRDLDRRRPEHLDDLKSITEWRGYHECGEEEDCEHGGQKKAAGPRTAAGKAKCRYNLARCLSLEELTQIDPVLSRYNGNRYDPCSLYFARIAALADLEIECVKKSARRIVESSAGPEPWYDCCGTGSEGDSIGLASVGYASSGTRTALLSRRAKAVQFL
jgi:hypothetical protein